jgi:hypothetical protein
MTYVGCVGVVEKAVYVAQEVTNQLQRLAAP